MAVTADMAATGVTVDMVVTADMVVMVDTALRRVVMWAGRHP